MVEFIGGLLAGFFFGAAAVFFLYGWRLRQLQKELLKEPAPLPPWDSMAPKKSTRTMFGNN